MKNLLLVLIFAVCFKAAQGQAGTVDPSFGNNGLVRTQFPMNNAGYAGYVTAVMPNTDGSMYLLLSMSGEAFVTHRFANGAIDLNYGENGYSVPLAISSAKAVMQPDGKIVVTGTTFINESTDFALARLTANGFLDNSFSGDGLTNVNLGDNTDEPRDIALQADGKIILAGKAAGDFALLRFNTDGSLDNSFSGDGKLVMDFGSAADAADAVALQTDAKIVIAGETGVNSWLTLAVARLLPDGTLDNSFSGDGKAIIPVGGYSQPKDMVIQPDGKIVIGGVTVNISNGNEDLMVVRLLSDATPDNSFSGDGFQTSDLGSREEVMQAIALQADGKIVVAGYRNGLNGYPHFLVARYNSDGPLDTGFSADGWDLPPVDNFVSFGSSIAVQADQKIVVGGISINDGYVAVRYNPNSTFDNNFDGDGILIERKPGANSHFFASAVQADGKLIAAGLTYDQDNNNEFAIARYNTDGSLDNSFSGNGKLTINFGNGTQMCTAIAIQPDGKIVLGGYSFNGTDNDVALARLNPDGTFDNSFSGDGMLLRNSGGDEVIYDLQLQPDGKIVVAGGITLAGNQDFLIERFNADGTPDNSFSGDGMQTTDFGTAYDWANSLLIQPDGKLVVAGNINWQDIGLARYTANGEPDPSFDADGKVITDNGGFADWAGAAALQPDGKIVVGGSITTNNGNDIMLLRYNTNGSLDNSLSGDGVAIIDGGSTTENILAIALQSDGRIILGGHSHGGSNNNFALFRFLPNGALDNSFSGDGRVVENFGLGEDIIEGLSIFGNRLYAVGVSLYGPYLGTVVAYQLGSSIVCTQSLNIPDAMAMSEGVNVNTVYLGYAPAGQLTLAAHVTGGTAPYTYSWSNGASTQSITVSPVIATTYAVNVVDARGCSSSFSKLVNVTDVRCGNKSDKVMVCQVENKKSNTICISANAVQAHLKKGSYLGNCTAGQTYADALRVSVLPNPSYGSFTLDITGNPNRPAELVVYDAMGRLIERRIIAANRSLQLGDGYKPGIYLVQVMQGNEKSVLKLIKK